MQGSLVRGGVALVSPPEVLPDILVGSMIVDTSISLKVLSMLLRAPHHEP